MAVRQAPAGQRAHLIAQLGQLQRALPPAIVTAKNGPYLVTNVTAVRTPLGETLTLPPQLALCRCGGSAAKPFCDGTHAGNGFTDAKDPNRVPDQRDTYPGEQVTVFDNRGICQHSGLCTDRLATVFRAGAEPFVAPSGGRMDEIVRAVRDCPSGALSLAFDGAEARDLADWHASREAAIEVTQDGPYRVSGGIGLTDAAGADVPRAAGSSREHYALCRCGHSQNKPFCSGMHWYVEFRDPARERGADPVRVGRRPARADPDDPAALREARARRRPARAAVRHHGARLSAARGGRAGRGLRRTPGRTAGRRRARLHRGAARPLGRAGHPGRRRGRPARRPRIPLGPHVLPRVEFPGRRRTPARMGLGSGRPARPHTASTGTGQPRDDQPGGYLARPGRDGGFAAHIKPLFREHDRKSMAFAFDLWSQADVQTHAAGILERLQNGTMPCDGAWPPAKIEVFKRWTESGFQP